MALVSSLICASHSALAAPAGVDEGALAVHQLAEIVVADALANAVLLAPVARGNEHVLLNAHQQVGHVFAERVERDRTLLALCRAARARPGSFVEVARAKFQAQRDAAQLPLVILGAWLHAFARVDVHAEPAGITTLPVAESLRTRSAASSTWARSSSVL